MSKSEKEALRNYLLGQSIGLDEAAEFLLQRASVIFKDGNRDDEARLLRNLANEIQIKADARYKHPNLFGGPSGNK